MDVFFACVFVGMCTLVFAGLFRFRFRGRNSRALFGTSELGARRTRSSKLSPGIGTVIMYGNFITGFDLRLIDLG